MSSHSDITQLYSTLVNQARDHAVFLMGADRTIKSWNIGVQDLLGYSEAEFIDRSADIIFTPEDREQGEPQGEMQKALECGTASDIRWHLRKDGERVFAVGSLVTLRNEGGDLLGFGKIMRDATEIREYQENLEELTEGLNLAQTMLRDPDGTIRFWSQGCERLFGFTSAEAKGQKSHELLRTVFPEPLSEINRRLELTRGWRGRLVQCCKNGDRLTVISDWLLHRNVTQNEITVIESSSDITAEEHERTERERLVRELDTILASTPDALYVGDASGITRVNQMGLDQLGFETAFELRQDIGSLAERIQTRDPATGQRLGAEEQPFTQALQGQTVVREVAFTHLTTGEEIIVRCASRPILQDGRVVGAIAINSDITAQKKAAAERERLVAALQRSNDQLNEFAYVVSHDLQAPIRMVKSYTELLRRRYRGKLDETADEFMDTVLEGTRNMEELIEALLSYAQAGQDLPRLTALRVQGVIDAVLTILEPVVTETDAEIRCGPLPVVEADRIQLQQLFQNLIGNALKYRNPSERPQIQISATELPTEWRFAVQDNGIGIPQADSERVFEPLRRLHGRSVPGIGMGLAVCRSIVQRHGGRIWLESEPGIGSTFFFTLSRPQT